MNVVSLFTGVGGFDLGLERAGHRIVAHCEADEKARAVLRRHWPDVPIYDDVVTYEPTESADLVAGGFPCQDLSVAGKRAGLAGERSGLFFEAVRIADAVLEPGGWVLIENVPGLLSSNDVRGCGIVLASLAERGFYDLAWRVLDSRYFGVAQRRRRVFILGRRASGRRAAQVLLDPEGGGGSSQSGLIPRESVAKWPKGRYPQAGGDPPPDPDRVGAPSGFSGRVDDPVTAFHATQTPIHSTEHAPSLGSSAQIGVMGSGSGDTSCPYDPKPDSPRYAQMGNAVTVPVAEWIGHRLREFGCGS